jgi:hypothetical protein
VKPLGNVSSFEIAKSVYVDEFIKWGIEETEVADGKHQMTGDARKAERRGAFMSVHSGICASGCAV